MGYKYHTPNAGKAGTIKTDSGVFIASKYPIVFNASTTFGKVCGGKYSSLFHLYNLLGGDCVADKGVMYAKISWKDKFIHIFGTHLNAGRYYTSVREKQLKIIREFADSFNISKEELVLFSGDFNIDFHDPEEYQLMLKILRVAPPNLVGYPYTYDYKVNTLISSSLRYYLDFILYDVEHLKPTNHFHQSVILKTTTPWIREWPKRGENWDLSDHFPVYAYFNVE